MYESGIMIHIKIYKSSFNNTQSWQVSSSLIFCLSCLRETLSYSHQASDVTLICNCELIYGVYVCVWHKMPRWGNFTPKGVSNTAQWPLLRTTSWVCVCVCALQITENMHRCYLKYLFIPNMTHKTTFVGICQYN